LCSCDRSACGRWQYRQLLLLLLLLPVLLHKLLPRPLPWLRGEVRLLLLLH
jgi:hypothetical protein